MKRESSKAKQRNKKARKTLFLEKKKKIGKGLLNKVWEVSWCSNHEELRDSRCNFAVIVLFCALFRVTNEADIPTRPALLSHEGLSPHIWPSPLPASVPVFSSTLTTKRVTVELAFWRWSEFTFLLVYESQPYILLLFSRSFSVFRLWWFICFVCLSYALMCSCRSLIYLKPPPYGVRF